MIPRRPIALFAVLGLCAVAGQAAAGVLPEDRSDALYHAYIGGGVDSREHGAEWGRARSAEYTKRRYHKPADEFDEEWDLAGAAEDLELYFEVGVSVAGSSEWPAWS